MSSIQKLKKSRQTNAEVGDKTFTITRPTPMQAMVWLVGLKGDPLSRADLKVFYDQRFSLHNEAWRKIAQEAIKTFVIDWPGMREMDVFPGGTGAPIAFEKELFLLWVEDHPSIITGLAYKIFEAWLNYLTAQEADEKKPETGSSPDS